MINLLHHRLIFSVFVAGALGACAPFVPVVDMASVSQQQRAAAAQVQVFQVGQNPPRPFTYVGSVQANSCKHLLWNAPASMSDAIEQLKLKTMQAGGDAVSDVACTRSGTDTYGTNCWNSVQCGGTAIKLPPAA